MNNKIVFSDLIYLKEKYDTFLKENLTNKSLLIQIQIQTLKDNFIKAARLYYESNNLEYTQIIELYNKDKKALEANKKDISL